MNSKIYSNPFNDNNIYLFSGSAQTVIIKQHFGY